MQSACAVLYFYRRSVRLYSIFPYYPINYAIFGSVINHQKELIFLYKVCLELFRCPHGAIIRCGRNNQHNAQICTTALFYMLAATCFGSSLPSSGSFWIRLSYVKIQIDMVVYHIMWLSVTECHGSVSAGKHNTPNHDTPSHRPLNHII
jgi:hypothetical protein